MFLGKYDHTDTTETAHIMRIIKSAWKNKTNKAVL
jgi:hypothetical protein